MIMIATRSLYPDGVFEEEVWKHAGLAEDDRAPKSVNE